MIGCHSCVFSDLDCRIASPTPGRLGCSGRNSRRPAPSGHCSSASMQPFGNPGTSPWRGGKAVPRRGARPPDDWKDKPAKLRQKDRDARWTVKYTKAKPREDGSTPPVDLAIPVFGYQNHISLDRGFGFIRKWSATDAAAYEGRRLRDGLLDKTNTASSVWADTAYRSAANEEFMERNGFVSHVHRKRPKGRPMPEAIRRANTAKSKIRSRVEHVFA